MLGEDSGLEVAALGGAPGVRSARYGAEGGEAIERLLRELEGVDDRRARYVCELVLLDPSGAERRGSGVLKGRTDPQAAALDTLAAALEDIESATSGALQ